MKVSLQSIVVICLVIVSPYTVSAQKKNTTGPSAQDQQMLDDAYDVLESVISTGRAKDMIFYVPTGERAVNYTYEQSNVVTNRKVCGIQFDFRDPEMGDISKRLVAFSVLDIRSLKVVPLDDTGTDRAYLERHDDDFKVSHDGFALKWSYLKGLTEGATATTKDGTKYELAFRVFLSTQEDGDRVQKALAYAAKSCGARESAF